MKDRFFVDTNVFVYAALEDEDEKIKSQKAIEFFEI
jgi:predicted nucleic acid-binding protein